MRRCHLAFALSLSTPTSLEEHAQGKATEGSPPLQLRAGSPLPLVPIIRRQRHSPNVLSFLQFDSAVSRLVWINVHDLGCSAFVCDTDMNLDSHPHAQCNGSQNQGAMEVDDECLTFARQRFRNALSLEQNLQTNSGASSGFTRPSVLRKSFNVSHRAP
jgi:hypothetical protein